MASVQPGHSHGDLHDDESLLGDDLIEADDGEFLKYNHWPGGRIALPALFC